MNSIRKWLYKPKKRLKSGIQNSISIGSDNLPYSSELHAYGDKNKTDQSLLAQFFYADEDLNAVTSELDSFDGRKDPDRCTALVNHLRQCQDKVLNICQMLMDEVIPEDRAPRDFRAKFPDDVLQENLAGQLWFGAECLAAGSSILNRELESTTMRPLAKAFTKSLENVRNLLREQCFRNPPEFTEKICESLKILDRLFSEFELSYVSAMVPVKTVHEYEAQQAITVLFSETLQRALGLGLLCQDQVESCDPAVMFTIPRLAIVAGLLIFPDGPLCLDHGELSEMFRPFRSLLLKIRELLWTLTRPELSALERALCSSEEPDPDSAELADDHLKGHEDSTSHPHHYYPSSPPAESTEVYGVIQSRPEIRNGTHSIQDYLDQFCKDFPHCKEFISDLCNNSSHANSGPVPNNEMTVSQYSMNLSQSTGVGDVPPTNTTRHQLHPNSVTVVNHTNSTNCYIEDGTTTEGTSGSIGSHTVKKFCCAEQEKSKESHPVENGDEEPEIKTLGRKMSHSYSSCDDELPRSTVETESGSRCLNSPDEVEVVPISHASSSSSHDSGLCSMTEKDAPTDDSTGPSFDYPTLGPVDTNSRPIQSTSPPPTYLSHSTNCSCNNTNNSGGSISKSTLLQIPDSVEDRHVRTNPRLPSSSQDVPVCSGNCCRTSPGDESACDTSSFDSECQDDIEIALALQAAEIATRTEARSRFKNSADLIHRLFICISGVADQLQTNYAADLRSTLKCVFAMNATPGEDECDEGGSLTHQDTTPEPSLDEEIHESDMNVHHYHVESSQSTEVISPPSWVPDELAPQCMACLATFTVVRRRHHCRACGKVFCGKCSGNSVPLPRYGYGMKPQRVCNTCFVYRVTPFTLPSSAVAESL